MPRLRSKIILRPDNVGVVECGDDLGERGRIVADVLVGDNDLLGAIRQRAEDAARFAVESRDAHVGGNVGRESAPAKSVLRKDRRRGAVDNHNPHALKATKVRREFVNARESRRSHRQDVSW